MVLLYHYTNKRGAEGIERDKMIKISTKATSRLDACSGEGVYLTAMTPDRGKTAIARNNWDGIRVNHGQIAKLDGKLDYAVKVDIPQSDFRLRAAHRHGRDMYRYGRATFFRVSYGGDEAFS